MLDWRFATKPKRQMVLGVILFFGLVAGDASAAERPLVIPESKFPNIPEGDGMKFFYGRWRPSTPPQGGLVRITSERMASERPGDWAVQYRVIYEGINFVLIVEQYDPPDVKYPTKFVILTSERPGFMARPRHYLVRHSCGYGTWGTRAAFDWPIEKLLETFKSSMCFRNVNFDDPAGIGWSSTRLERLPDQ